MTGSGTASIPCNLCGQVKASVLSQRSRSGKPLRTVVCEQCGLVWSDPRPHDAKSYYKDEYRLEYKQTFEPQPKHVLRAGKVALARLKKIRPCLNGRMRILDVGSGGGEFAYLLRTLGHDVHGIEPNLGYAAYAAREYGLPITRGFIGDTRLTGNGYDLITVWHVLEHTEDPLSVLQQLQRALRPGGTLVVEVPNVEATCQSPRSTFHEAHFYNFNIATLQRMASRAGLVARNCQLSTDGGNITCLFSPAPEAPDVDEVKLVLPGNHDRVTRVVRAHTSNKHWLSLHPYRRFAGRMARTVSERLQLLQAGRGRQQLDALYSAALHKPVPLAETVHGRRSPWLWIGLMYAMALGLEWLLLDNHWPLAQWSELQRLAAYGLLTAGMVLGVARHSKQPRNLRQVVKWAAWAAPVVAIPAYC